MFARRLLLALALAAVATAASVTVTDDGDAVTLATSAGTRATLTRGGAALQSFVTPDRDGKLADIVLGMDDAKAYEVRERGGGCGVRRSESFDSPGWRMRVRTLAARTAGPPLCPPPKRRGDVLQRR